MPVTLSGVIAMPRRSGGLMTEVGTALSDRCATFDMSAHQEELPDNQFGRPPNTRVTACQCVRCRSNSVDSTTDVATYRGIHA